MLPIAMAITVLLSSYVIRIQTMWQQVPHQRRLRHLRGVWNITPDTAG
jgi:hypothetical protein